MSYATVDVLANRPFDELTFTIDFFVDPYDDPETGERFEEVSWSVSYYPAGGSPGFGLSGYASGGGDTIQFLDLLSASAATHNYVLLFHAENTFSAQGVTRSWNVFNHAYDTAPLAFAGGATDDIVLGGAAADTILGLAGEDHLDGGEGDDTLDGGDDGDVIRGDYGDDTALGGNGNDWIDGGGGDDTMIGGSGDDTFIVEAIGDAVVETASGGYDTVRAVFQDHTLAANVERLILVDALQGTGNAGANRIDGNQRANRLEGLAGDDQLFGADGNDTLLGGLGDDRLDGNIGGDTMLGGAGDDTYLVDWLYDTVSETAGEGVDTVVVSNMTRYILAANFEKLTVGPQVFGGFVGFGNGLANTITATADDDSLYGRTGDDVLEGLNGNDWLVGGLGADILIGGNGIDTAYYGDSALGVAIDLLAATARGGEAEGDRLYSVENLHGSQARDILVGDAAANSLWGLAGNDTLDGGAGNDVVRGGAGADTMFGGGGIDTLSYGGSDGGPVSVNLLLGTAAGGDAQGDLFFDFENVLGGNAGDTLVGGNGANSLSGGGGGDTIDGGGGDDTINGGAGPDILVGGSGIDTVSYSGAAGRVVVDLAAQTANSGDAQGDTLAGFENATGGNGNDFIRGSSLANVLNGGSGIDNLNGGDGNDTIVGGAGGDTLAGGLGIDTLSYAGAVESVTVNLAGLTALFGDAAGDTFSGFENLMGGEGGDGLTGDDAANRLWGRAGFDLLDGGLGDDILNGGGGGDAFLFAAGNDTIVDFTAVSGAVDVDRLVLALGAAFDSFAEVMAAATQVGAHTVFTFGAGQTLRLLNVQIATLSETHFEFV
jgi:Ca2+-binding RTX toxin-like protein